MSAAAITLEVLPAGYGDCLLVSCPVGAQTWRLLVDTGPDETYPRLRERLSRLPLDEHGERHIDLLIVSHIDHDHIGSVGPLLQDESLHLTFGDIWFNAPHPSVARGVAEGIALARLLGAGERKLPWNEAFGGAPAVTPGSGEFLALRMPRRGPKLTLLSPDPARLEALFEVWARTLAESLAKAVDGPADPGPVARGDELPDVDALGASSGATDRAPANGSSIAVLLEHRGASALLGADAVPVVMVPALRALAVHRNVATLEVDAFKLSHHGSRANVTIDLLEAVQARHYVFSTNNAIFRHPDDESVARVLLHGGTAPTLWFNYGTRRNRRWDDAGLRAKHGHAVRCPDEGREGVILELAGRGRQ